MVTGCSDPAFDSKQLNWGRAAPQLNLPKRFDQDTRIGPHMVQQVGRDQQIPPNLLAMRLQPGGNVHGITEIRELTVRAAAFADRHGTGMQRRENSWPE